VGQQTHPKGFRLITTQEHLSNWYSTKFFYSNLIEEDFLIRKKVNETFKDLLSISDIQISRANCEDENKNYGNITINALFPRAKEMYKKITKVLTEETEIKKKFNPNSFPINISKGKLKKVTSFLLKTNIRDLIRYLQIKTRKSFFIKIKFIRNPFQNATLIANFIATQLEKRVPIRRTVKQIIKKAQLASIKGIKIQISGRLNGAERTKTEWKREGKIPLHTLRAHIDYTLQTAETIDGVIGIKVWLFIK
jgi:small subunit ribosomal protein S3